MTGVRQDGPGKPGMISTRLFGAATPIDRRCCSRTNPQILPSPREGEWVCSFPDTPTGASSFQSPPSFLCAIHGTRGDTRTAKEPCTSREAPASGVHRCAWVVLRRLSKLPSYPETPGGGVHAKDRQTPRETPSRFPLANARGGRCLQPVLADTLGPNRAERKDVGSRDGTLAGDRRWVRNAGSPPVVPALRARSAGRSGGRSDRDPRYSQRTPAESGSRSVHRRAAPARRDRARGDRRTDQTVHSDHRLSRHSPPPDQGKFFRTLPRARRRLPTAAR